jgi:AcrR family transcriptional regulator
MRGMASSKPHLSNKPLLRSHILDAARAIVVRQGFDALSMRKLAEVIGYSPASLYLHFAGRDAIAHELSVEGHAMLLAALHACDSNAKAAERARAMAHAYIAFGLTHPAMYRLMFTQNGAYANAASSDPEASGKTVLSLFSHALASSGSPANAEIVWAALHGLVSLSLHAGVKHLPSPTDALVDSLLDLCLPGVKKKPARRLSSSRTA